MLNCSPPNTFKSKPTMKQIWKWIKSFLTEYMKLKMKESEAGQDLTAQLMEFLNIKPSNKKALLPTIEALLFKNDTLQ